MASGDILAAIDIGSSKIVILLGDKKEGRLEVIGYAKGPSVGVKKGEIVDVEKVAEAIYEIGKQVRESYNTEFHGVAVNVSDPNLKTINLNPNIHIPNGKVREQHVKNTIMNAESVRIESTERQINSVVHYYTLDKDPNTHKGNVVQQPIGEKAENLEASIHIAVTSEQRAKNIEKSVEMNGIKVHNFVPSSMASSEPYLTEHQKEQGVCVVDIGSGVTDLSVFKNGGIFYSSAIQVAGDQITIDIADAFNTSFAEAERLKKKYGQVQSKGISEDKLVKFKQIDNNTQDYYLSYVSLNEVVQESYKNLFSLIRKKLNSQKLYRSLKLGFVLVGGGAKIKGCDRLMFDCYKKRAKIGVVDRDIIRLDPISISSNDDLLGPEYACALGLLLSNHKKLELEERQQIDNDTGLMGKIKQKYFKQI
ncbi:Cell division protein FtsA [hydrothermal vent metagenome]|uniref:Cell division protein FtsA n=1 Tax=hydrothermal vent metagenome TaxID=652676 RepID=A0A1W1DU57_9ZZZZ